MSYQVLARKWRPTNFADMVGQTPVLRALIYALDHGQQHHAYLFTGTRGVGKTTVARILAKCFNCERGVSSTPCGECASCVAIAQGRSLDLIEVDAASRTKVEQTRELLDNIHYAPTHSRFKIYLIDEVHMLSGHSFNALLKTLEEPPAHVKFLFATTDPDRLPLTILSRCLRFHLKNISEEEIAVYLNTILQQEKINAQPEALILLARAAQGSLRDALSLLDQAIAYGEGEVTTAAVRTLLGSLDTDSALSLLYAIHTQNTEKLFADIANLATQGVDFAQAFSEIAELLQHMAMYQACPDAITTEISRDPRFQTLCSIWTAQDIQIFYQIVIQGRHDLPWSVNPRSGLEMTLLRVLAFYPETENTTSTSATPTVRPATVAKSGSEVPKPAMTTTSVKPAPQHDAPVVQKETSVQSSSAAPTDQSWEQMVPQLKLSGMADTVAKNCVLKNREPGCLVLCLAPSHAPLLTSAISARIESAVTTYLGRPMRLEIVLESHQVETLAASMQKAQEKHKEQLGQSVSQDPTVQGLVQRFGAAVVNITETTPEKT